MPRICAASAARACAFGLTRNMTFPLNGFPGALPTEAQIAT